MDRGAVVRDQGFSGGGGRTAAAGTQVERPRRWRADRELRAGQRSRRNGRMWEGQPACPVQHQFGPRTPVGGVSSQSGAAPLRRPEGKERLTREGQVCGNHHNPWWTERRCATTTSFEMAMHGSAGTLATFAVHIHRPAFTCIFSRRIHEPSLITCWDGLILSASRAGARLQLHT